ncbi:hypothetical protein ACH5RR_013601 [Cinchona calisaya]|uniref:Peptidase A1 domain-containing protein n=1 Tax=Cinchona calisaya TaxID=153742 RepID=A0ABD3A1W1_9GENT
MLIWGCEAASCGTFGFDMHHSYSDSVKSILDLDGSLPERYSFDYYSATAHRDRLIRGRHLSTTPTSPLTFIAGNDTHHVNTPGSLYYANVSVGTPELWFLVALDTGSDLFWLPCDCRSCVRSMITKSGQQLDFNMYSPSTSSTSMTVPCNSAMCYARSPCLADSHDACPYKINYLSNGTSSSGLLIEDVLHFTTDDSLQKVVNAPITLGCGIMQTGVFLEGTAPNGLFGLGMESISVPSVIASKGIVVDSFSMCFGNDGIGRIIFGDKGGSDQGETPFNLDQLHPTYNVSVTQIAVGENITNVDCPVIFDSGTSSTYVNDPAYTTITENFNSRVEEPRYFQPDTRVPFEYCYKPRTDSFPAYVVQAKQGGGYMYCLGVVKSEDVNIIGQNYMTGYRVVFNREKMVLGWKASNCYDAEQTNTGSSNTFPINQQNATGAPSPSSVGPKATSARGQSLGAGSYEHNSNSLSSKALIFLFSLLFILS